MVIIKELEIRNCLHVKHVVLNFESNFYATVFNCVSTHKLRNIFAQAIQALFLDNYKVLKIGCREDLGMSYIRIKCLIPTKKREGFDVVDATRRCREPSLIFYTLNDTQYKEPINVFYEHCQLSTSQLYPFLNETYSVEDKNLMYSWISGMWAQKVAIDKSFELVADCVSKFASPAERKRLTNLTKVNLLVERECHILKQRTFFNVANEINTIFTYITFEEYSVQFFIPLMGTNCNVLEVKWEDIDLNNVETRVMKKGWQSSCAWIELVPGLKSLLKISQMLAFAIHLDQKFVIIEDTTLLLEYQNQEMIREAYLQKTQVHTTADWNRKNFIDRIVNICTEKEIMIFMNYRGGLPLPPSNANIISCSESTDEDNLFNVNTSAESMSLDSFIELIMKNNVPTTD